MPSDPLCLDLKKPPSPPRGGLGGFQFVLEGLTIKAVRISRPLMLTAASLALVGALADCDDAAKSNPADTMSLNDTEGDVTISCADGVKNGDETDVDCGGSCGVCAEGSACAAATDCASGYCGDGVCAAASCADTVLNGDETDVDCGGSCGACGDGGACTTAGDCQSGVCTDALCAAPACDDTVINGTETAVDCGGADCGGCPNQSACLEDSDCTNGVCDSTAKVCVDPGCTDNLLNAQETDVDCGGPDCGPCGVGAVCVTATDCDHLSGLRRGLSLFRRWGLCFGRL